MTGQAGILVTGATGFVGQALCPRLGRASHRVIAGLRHQGPVPIGATEARVLGDLSVAPHLNAVLTDIHTIVHLAGRAHVMQDDSTDPEQAFFAANAKATEHLARSAAAAGVQRLIFVSSIKVNGESTAGRAPFRHIDTPAPDDAYARSKLAAEQALRTVSARTGLEIVIIRPPLLHGPGVKGNLPRLMRLIDHGLPLPFAATHNRRSLLALTNLCDLIDCCLHHPAAAGQTLLASDEPALATPELIRLLAQGLKRQARLFPCPDRLLRLFGRLTGQSAAISRLTGSLEIDASTTRQRLGWTPPLPMAQSLREMAEDYSARAVSEECDPEIMSNDGGT